jgi:ketosteroid isomerase-like protein
MSQENVEIVRKSIKAFNERDVHTLNSLFAEDCVLRLTGGFADVMGAEFRGQEAVLGWMQDIVGAIGGNAEIEALRDVGDRVLMIVIARASGVASQADVTLRFGNVYFFRDGQISTLDSYYAVEAALKAVGLEE